LTNNDKIMTVLYAYSAHYPNRAGTAYFNAFLLNESIHVYSVSTNI